MRSVRRFGRYFFLHIFAFEDMEDSRIFFQHSTLEDLEDGRIFSHKLTLFFISVKLVTARAAPTGTPRDTYRAWAQIKTNVPYCLWGSSQQFSQNVVSELLRSLIAFQLLLKRVEEVSEEACDADGICVILQNQRWGKDLKYCWTFTWE